MTSVFKIHPNELKKKLLYINYLKNDNLKNSYNFLDIINSKYDIDITVYYGVIDMIEEFKLKNLLYFMNSRLIKTNKKIDYILINLTHNKLNEILNDFIGNDIVLSIIIMNLIGHYIYP
jgi:hypothetical protein